MPDGGERLRSVSWAETFPFVRLFSAFPHSIAFPPMVIALLAVVACYLTGRVLDAVWVAAGSGVNRVALSPSAAPDARFAAELEEAIALANAHFPPVSRDGQEGAQVAESRPGAPQRGPFASLLTFERRCAAAAIQGIAAGRWGFSGDAQPALLGSVAFAARGALWLVTQRPWFALIFGASQIAILSFFGGALCRWVAVRATRGESLGVGPALRFACEKAGALIAAPLAPPIAIAVLAAIVIAGGAVAGLFSQVPWLGGVFKVLAGLSFGLVLLAGLGMALIALLSLFGTHLMWPTVAVESSDAFDALQRAAGYLFPRAWHVGFYSFVLLLFGGVWLLVARFFALLVLKFSHAAADVGLSFFGVWTSYRSEDLSPLSAVWRMPAWNELSLFPALGGLPFWGAFGGGDLATSEIVMMWLLAFWVFLVVGWVAAFGVSFYFAGATHMYLLLRHNVDGVDFDEIFLEESDSEDDIVFDDTGEGGGPDPAPTAPKEPDGPRTDMPADT